METIFGLNVTYYLFIAMGLFLVLFAQVGKIMRDMQNKEPKAMKVHLWTFETKNGEPNGPPKADKHGRYVMKLLKEDFLLKVPLLINTDDAIIKPPLIEYDGILWVYHTIVQKQNYINLVVLYAGTPDPKKSVVCADPKTYKPELVEDTDNLKIVK